jgi:hypothetical protein
LRSDYIEGNPDHYGIIVLDKLLKCRSVSPLRSENEIVGVCLPTVEMGPEVLASDSLIHNKLSSLVAPELPEITASSRAE